MTKKNKIYKIPNKPFTYKEKNSGKPELDDPVPKDIDIMVYYTNKNEKIIVTNWWIYPTYDFIFGIPDKTNK